MAHVAVVRDETEGTDGTDGADGTLVVIAHFNRLSAENPDVCRPVLVWGPVIKAD